MENRLQELEHWKGTMLSTNAMFSDVKELENYLLERIEAQVCVSVCVYEREEAQKSVREPRCVCACVFACRCNPLFPFKLKKRNLHTSAIFK